MRPSSNLQNKIPSDILKSSGSTYEGSDVFYGSRLVMTYLTNLEVTEILCSFRLDQSLD